MITWQRWCFVWEGDLLKFCYLPWSPRIIKQISNKVKCNGHRKFKPLWCLEILLPLLLCQVHCIHMIKFEDLFGQDTFPKHTWIYKIIEPYTVEPHRPQLNLTMHLTTLDIYNRHGLKMNHMMIGKGTRTYKNKNSFEAWHWVSILTLKSYGACLLNCFFQRICFKKSQGWKAFFSVMVHHLFEMCKGFCCSCFLNQLVVACR